MIKLFFFNKKWYWIKQK